MYRTPWVSPAAHGELPTPLPWGVTPMRRAGYHSETHRAPQPFPCAERDGPQRRYPGLPEEWTFKFCILANTLRFTGGLYWGCGDLWDGLGSLSTASIPLPPHWRSSASLPGTAPYLDVAEDTPGAGAGPFGDVNLGFASFGVDSHRGGFPGSPK